MDCTLVDAGASDAAALRPRMYSVMGEYQVLAIDHPDDVKHAVAYREMSLILRRPPGRGLPGDFLPPRLLKTNIK